MDTKAAYHQAFRELRANGRIGYSVLRNPAARMAASEVLALRPTEDALLAVRRRIALLQAERLLRSYPIQSYSGVP